LGYGDYYFRDSFEINAPEMEVKSGRGAGLTNREGLALQPPWRRCHLDVIALVQPAAGVCAVVPARGAASDLCAGAGTRDGL
jgi:hypothetical protein